MMAVMTAMPKSTQLRLLRWKLRQSTANRATISSARTNVTTVSVASGKSKYLLPGKA